MNLFLYTLVIACLIAGARSQRLFPLEPGCSPGLYTIDDKGICNYTVYCKDRLDLSCDQRDECNNRIRNRNGQYCVPVSVVYKDNNMHETIYYNEYLSSMIYSFDLSDNDYFNVPTFVDMDYLAILKMKRCVLTTAKLSNKNMLPALIELDYSENAINNIEVTPGEYEYKTLKKLNLSHNNLENIPEGSFESFDDIESLDLSHNFFFVLDMMYFEGIRKLQHLDLSFNLITGLDLFFIRLRYLLTLNLSHNHIKELKTRDFGKLSYLQVIKLNSNQIQSIENNLFENMESLTTIDLSDNTLEVIEQEIFTNNTKLIHVYLARNKFKKVPKNLFKGKTITNFTIEKNSLEGSLERGIFEGLGMVTELDLSDQHLTSVDNYAFAGLHNLRTLSLSNNDLDLLSNYSFKALPNLNCLDLSYNKIEKIDYVTDDLSSLQILLLHHNNIIHISNNYFLALGSLQMLDLSHNNISHISPNTFCALQSLTHFKISKNPLLGSIEEKTFAGLSSLPSLDISGTSISTLNNGSFIGLTLLEVLDVSHSNITELQYNCLSYMNEIISIDLSYNQLSVFDVNTTDLRYLTNLVLNNNRLKVISKTLFKEMSVLNALVLSHNELNNIHKEAFYALKHIRTLDLSYNSELKVDLSLLEKAQSLDYLRLSGTKVNFSFAALKNIPLTRLEMAHSNIQNISTLGLSNLRLQILELNNNDVQKLEVGSLSNLMNLKILDLSYNGLTYIQPGVFKDNLFLNVLNISNNMLTEISFGMFRGLEQLQVLDLSYNKIKNLHQARLYDVDHLKTLIVDHNEIYYISEEDFIHTSLSKLSIGGNPLPCGILVNLNKMKLTFTISAINVDETKENVHGVTCNKNDHFDHIDNTDLDASPGNRGQEKLLLDIRNILYNVSKARVTNLNSPGQAKTTGGDIHTDSFNINNIIKQQQELNIKNIEIINSVKNLSSIVNTNTNSLLAKILQALISKPSFSISKPIVVPKENASSDSLLPYINKIKQDLESTIAISQQNVLELDNKIERLNSRIDSEITTRSPVQDKLVGIGNKEIAQRSSTFTEVCVGLILVILVCFIAYKVYKSRLYIFSGRSTISTRNITEAMENSNL